MGRSHRYGQNPRRGRAAACGHATTWVTIKTRWKLSTGPAEAAALTSTLNVCPNTPMGDVPSIPTARFDELPV
ncbi:hypothetical protein GCM10010349_75180 [Streptomyces flavofungini]|nr:hypothetical protein GCM10010349_75180 [Streptomyces flavofungini]